MHIRNITDNDIAEVATLMRGLSQPFITNEGSAAAADFFTRENDEGDSAPGGARWGQPRRIHRQFVELCGGGVRGAWLRQDGADRMQERHLLQPNETGRETQ
jgi:hypothetical protein